MRVLPIEIIDTECVLSSFFAVKILFLQNGVFKRAFLVVPEENCAWCECIFLSSKVYENSYDNQLCNLPESRFTAFAWIPNFCSSRFFPVGEIDFS